MKLWLMRGLYDNNKSDWFVFRNRDEARKACAERYWDDLDFIEIDINRVPKRLRNIGFWVPAAINLS